MEKEGREFALHTAMEFMYYSDFGYCGTQYPSDCIPNDAKYSATSGCGMNTQTRIWRHRYIHRYKYGHTDTYVDTHLDTYIPQTHTYKFIDRKTKAQPPTNSTSNNYFASQTN